MARGPDRLITGGHGIDFARLPWESPNPKMRHKAVHRGNFRLRLIEVEKGYEEPSWCEHGHVIYVLEGDGPIDFDGTEQPFREGDAVVVPAGPAHRHRLSPGGDLVRLFVVDTG
ncbi:MAG TPA: cupin domain-containing protein [Alphaproteobacteria bacterium]|nr:cupin domain-containing protein [Alphaproteobacteria bacterium]